MPRQKLMSVSVDPQKWEDFKALCEEKNSSASVEILRFIDWTLAGNQLPQSEITNPDLLNHRLEEIEARLATLEEAFENPRKSKRKHRNAGSLSLPSLPLDNESV